MSIVDETNPLLPYQLVLVYASSGCPFSEFAIDLGNMVFTNMTTIITGDFNKTEKNPLTEFLKEQNFIQLVAWPKQKEGTTIGKKIF